MSKYPILILIILTAFTHTAAGLDEVRFIYSLGGLNLRSEPDLAASKIAVIPDGEKVTLLEERGAQIVIADAAGKWSRIKWRNFEGWVFGGFQSDRPAAQTRLAAAGEYGPVFTDSGLFLYVSKDDTYLYVMSADTATLFWFTRNSITGEPVLAGEYTHPDLRGARLLFSEDNAFIYGAAASKISCFRRDTRTGAVTHADTFAGNYSGIAEDTVLARDGRHLYTMIRQEGYCAIACLSRDPVSGKLTQSSTYHQDNQVFNPGLTLSPDGRHVYTIENSGNILYFDRNPDTGVLQPAGAFSVKSKDESLRVSRLMMSPDGISLNGEAITGFWTEGGAVTVSYRFWLFRDQTTGSLTLKSAGESFSSRPEFFSPDGSLFFCVAGSSLNVKKINMVSGDYDYVQSVDIADWVIDGTVSGDGKYVYIFDLNRLVWFSCNADTGNLSPAGIFKDTNELSSPLDLAFSPDNKHLYVLSDSNDSIAAFSRDQNGKITYIDSYGGADGLLRPLEIVLSPDGKFIYTDSIAPYKGFYVFSRDSSTGKLAFEKFYYNEFGWDTDELIISPDGNFLFALEDTKIGWYRINRETGRLLDFTSYTHDAIIKAKTMVMSPDNKHLYVNSCPDSGEQAILWFAWNPAKAELVFKGRYQSAEIGYAGSIVISKNGKDIYTGNKALFRFKRDPVSGALTLKETFDGIYGRTIVISPDEDNVYVAKDKSVITYKRYTNTGELLYVDTFADDTELSRVTFFGISPDGKNLYLLDASLDKVFYFDRIRE